jgi:hypothetical protein
MIIDKEKEERRSTRGRIKRRRRSREETRDGRWSAEMSDECTVRISA